MNEVEKTRSELIEDLQAAQRKISELESLTVRLRGGNASEGMADKTEHLNAVLRAIRNVNQLIVHEKSPERLIRMACRYLTETLGYFNAWIVYFDDDGRMVSVEQANVGQGFSVLKEQLESGQWPNCAQRALKNNDMTVVADPLSECRNCPLAAQYSGRAGYCAVLRHEKKIYGLLSVSVPARFAQDDEEKALFRELADDLAFALYRIELEEKHRRDQFRLGLLFQQAADAIFVCTMDGKFLDVNERACLQSGYTREELLSMNVIDLDSEFSQPHILAEYFKSLEPNLSTTLQSTHRRKDGHTYPVEITISRIQTPDGDQIMGVVRDISKRVEAARSLKESEERFRMMMEKLPAGFFAHDLDGNFVMVNRKACLDTGYSREELLALSVQDIDPASETRKDRETLWTLLESSDSLSVESEHRRKDGSTYPVEVHLSTTRLLGKPVILGISFNISKRKQLEIERENRELFLQDLIDQSPFATWIADAEGTLVQSNPALRSYLNLTDEQLIGNYNIFSDPQLKEQGVEEKVKSVYNQGKTVHFELVWNGSYIDRDMFAGSNTVHIEATMYPIFDSKHKLTHVVTQWVDITKRKKAEEDLKNALFEQEAIFESSMVGIMVLHNRIMTKVNRRMAGMLGYTPEELENISPEPIHVSYQHFVRFGESYYWRLAERELVQIEYPLRHKNGKTIWCMFSGKAIAPPDLGKGAVWVVDDITERKRMRDELVKKNLAANQAEILAELGYFERNWQSGDGFWSEGFCRLLGLDEGDVRSHDDFMTFVHEEDRSRVAEHIRNSLEHHTPMDVQFRLVTKHGKVIDIHGIGATVYDEKGRPSKTHGTFQNVTKRKEAEKKRQKLEEQLRQSQKMESIGRLAGGVAHDFNNLLTGISGNISLALMDLDPIDPLVEMLEEIDHASQSAADLTRQLLAFSRKQIIKLQPLDLNLHIESMHRMLVRLIGEHIELQTVPFPSLGTVKADPGQVEQILINLAVNARDAMPHGGKLLLETANVTLDEKYCAMHPDVEPGDYVMIAVSDTGEGMDKDTLSKVFDPFFTTKKESEGTGLGLATVYGIVKQHKGNIEVYSEPGHGTTFKVYLPRVQESAEAVVRKTLVDNLPTGNETVLVVEDEPMVRKIAVKILSRQGYTVLEAESGGEALALVDDQSPSIDLLMTDIVMPNMNGRVLSEKLRERYENLKVLFTSGYTENVIAHHGVLEKGLHFIGKPYSPLTLAKKVRKVLDE